MKTILIFGQLSALLLAFWGWLWLAPAYAAAPRLFEISGVQVDVTADSAQDARMKALAQGEKEAFQTLLKRLTLSAYYKRLPNQTSSEIKTYIQDFKVEDEKASAVRYIATLTYNFRAASVRELLDEYAIPYAETNSKPVLLLPVYQAAGALSLWDDPNPWRAAWDLNDQTKSASGLVPMVLPKGDLQDMRTIGAEQAIEGDMARLEDMTFRYETGDVVVAHGILRREAYDGGPELEVYLTRFGSALQEHTVVKSFTALKGESVADLLIRAVVQLNVQIEDNWKQDNLIQRGVSHVLPLTVRVDGLNDWVQIRRRLNGVAIVRKTQVALLRQGEVRLNLHFIGDSEQLALSLDQADLSLWEEAGVWYLGQKSKQVGGQK